MGLYIANFFFDVVFALVEFVELRTLAPLLVEGYRSFLVIVTGVLQRRVLDPSWSMPALVRRLSILVTCLLTYWPKAEGAW
jgi:hypothetical protein